MKGNHMTEEGNMKERIGLAAGKVWEMLKANGEMDISALTKKMDERSVIVQQALGWLAREDKIDYDLKGKKIFVTLSEHEKNGH